MLRNTNLEEGTSARHVSREVKDDGYSISDVELKRSGSTRTSKISLYVFVRKWSKYATRRTILRSLRRRLHYGNLFVWFMYSMILDTVFLYAPVIKDDQKCWKADKSGMSLAIVLRSLCDSLFLVLTLSRICGSYRNSPISKVLVSVFDIFIILPLPQVLVILAYKQGISGPPIFFYGMYVFLGQHLVKVIRSIKVCKEVLNSVVILAGWFQFALSYFHVANAIGAIWYFFAVERKITCWRKACISPGGCDNLSFYCNNSNSSGNYTFSNNFCSTKTENMTTYDFGLFHDAIHFDVVGHSTIFQRFLPCIRWSLQNISSFGQGLPFSNNVGENIFVIFITISSVSLFYFLIAKAQFEMSKLEERSQQVNEIDRGLHFRKLPKNLKKRVKRYQASHWGETRGIDIGQFVNNLPHNLGQEIKRELCLDLLKKVKEFGEWNGVLLKHLCDLTKPVHFAELSYIVREGDPIDKMLFVLQGELWFYSSRIVNRQNGQKNYLEDGDCCGEELVAWAQAHSDSSNLPVSTKTIQAHTNVEAFVLIADDLNRGIQLINIKIKWAARCIQLFWRSKSNALTSTS